MESAGNSMLWKKLHDPASVTPRSTRWPPTQNQFPSKYDQLPKIGPGETPRGNSKEGQLVPLNLYRKGSPNEGYTSYRRNMDNDTDERVRQIEMRLGVSEKSNRALLEEVLRLQNDLRNTSKKSEDILREERDSRQQLSEAIRISNELISQLSLRIKETEDKIEDEKDSLRTLFSHTKNVEKTVVQSQADTQQRRDAQSLRLQELRAELNDTKSSKNQLEQVTFALTEEMRSLRGRVENQQVEFGNVLTDMRNRTRKLEEENKLQLNTMRKQTDLHNMTDINSSQLRGQVETRLSELRDFLMDLRGKYEVEQNERRNLEKSLQTKIGEITNQISEQSRKREEGLHSVDMVLREKDHAAQAERLQLNAKVTDTVEDVNKRLLAKEMKLREEIQAKYLQLEKLLQRESHSRTDYEKGAKEETERRWSTLKKVLEEELGRLKENVTTERGRNKEALNKLDQSITILEKQLAENKKQVDKVMTAEIKSRKIHEAGTTEKIASVNEKLQIATSTLQQAIGGISQSLASNTDKTKRELKQMLNEQQQGSTRALSDMDARMNALKQRLANMEDMLDSKVSSKFQGRLTNRDQNNEENDPGASQNLSERMTDRLEAISKWQDATGDTLRELGRSVQTLPQEIYQMEERMKLLKSEMDSRVSHESDTRSREVEQLRQDLAALKSRMDRQPKPASLQDLEASEGPANGPAEMNVNVRKLADNLQTVKTVLGMKIQSEQKLRTDEVEHLQRQLDDLKKVVEPLVGRNNPHFVKDGDGRQPGESPEVNNWSVHNAYKDKPTQQSENTTSPRRQQSPGQNTRNNTPQNPQKADTNRSNKYPDREQSPARSPNPQKSKPSSRRESPRDETRSNTPQNQQKPNKTRQNKSPDRKQSPTPSPKQQKSKNPNRKESPRDETRSNTPQTPQKKPKQQTSKKPNRQESPDDETRSNTPETPQKQPKQQKSKNPNRKESPRDETRSNTPQTPQKKPKQQTSKKPNRQVSSEDETRSNTPQTPQKQPKTNRKQQNNSPDTPPSSALSTEPNSPVRQNNAKKSSKPKLSKQKSPPPKKRQTQRPKKANDPPKGPESSNPWLHSQRRPSPESDTDDDLNYASG